MKKLFIHNNIDLLVFSKNNSFNPHTMTLMTWQRKALVIRIQTTHRMIRIKRDRRNRVWLRTTTKSVSQRQKHPYSWLHLHFSKPSRAKIRSMQPYRRRKKLPLLIAPQHEWNLFSQQHLYSVFLLTRQLHSLNLQDLPCKAPESTNDFLTVN